MDDEEFNSQFTFKKQNKTSNQNTPKINIVSKSLNVSTERDNPQNISSAASKHRLKVLSRYE